MFRLSVEEPNPRGQGQFRKPIREHFFLIKFYWHSTELQKVINEKLHVQKKKKF